MQKYDGHLLMILFMIAVLIQVSKYVELFNYSGLLPAIKTIIGVWLTNIILSGVIPDCLSHQLLIDSLFPPIYKHKHLWKILFYAMVIWSFLNLCVLFPQLFLVLTLCAVFWVSFLHKGLLLIFGWLFTWENVHYLYFISLCCLAVGQKGSGDHLLHFAIFGYDMVSDRLSIILKNMHVYL